MLIRHVLAPGGIIAVLLAVSACDRIGSTRQPEKAWYTADLSNYSRVDWEPTNSIPLQPDAAVLAALSHLHEMYGSNTVWRIDSIRLEKDDWSPWMYQIECKSGEGRDLKWEFVKVLLSGQVWKQRGAE